MFFLALLRDVAMDFDVVSMPSGWVLVGLSAFINAHMWRRTSADE